MKPRPKFGLKEGRSHLLEKRRSSLSFKPEEISSRGK
jgi:hypothetical protein